MLLRTARAGQQSSGQPKHDTCVALQPKTWLGVLIEMWGKHNAQTAAQQHSSTAQQQQPFAGGVCGATKCLFKTKLSIELAMWL